MELHKNFKREDIICISLSVDEPEDREKVLTFLRSQNAEFDNVLASEGGEAMLDKLALGSQPAAYVYDRQGELAKRFDNSNGEEDDFTYKDVEALVAKLIDQE